MESTNPFDATEPQTDPGANLAALDEEYRNAEEASLEEVPDARYQVRVQGARVNKSQSGNPMLQYDLLVLAGKYEGRHIFKNSVFTPAALPFVKAELKMLGVTLERLSELPTRLEELLDKTLEVNVRTRGEYRNVYFVKLLDIPEGGSEEIGPAPF